MDPHRVFGIVFSSEDLPALEMIVSQLESDTGSTYILLQETEPGKAPLPLRKLAAITELSIEDAREGVSLLANRIYVAPANQLITVIEGRFSLSTQVSAKLSAYDVLLNSLAQQYQDRAVAVVLSGHGSNGRRGAVTIRQQDGLLLLKSSADSGKDTLQNKLAEIGAPDIVLSPEHLTSLIVTLASEEQHPDEVKPDTSTYKRIMAAMLRRNNIDFSRYKITTVQRRIARRMFLNRLGADLNSYLQLIESSPEEAMALCRDILIGVSRFFRDPEMFELLTEQYLAELVENCQNKELRIWVAGCASGEEAYSYAITCLRFFRAQQLKPNFKILASDVNPAAIEKADFGEYSRHIEEDVPPDVLNNYFYETDKGYRVSDQVREKVIFFRHDMAEDIPFTQIDLVSCRNVFIYFNAQVQSKVARCFGFALKRGGLLILSPSESLTDIETFRVLDDRWRIYQLGTKPRFIQSPVANGHFMVPNLTERRAVSRLASKDEEVRERLLKLLAERYVPLILILTGHGEIVYVFGDANGILHFPSGEPSNDLSQLKDPNLRLPISSGIRKLMSDAEEIDYQNITIQVQDGQEVQIDLRMQRLPGTALQQDLVAVLFEALTPAPRSRVVSEQGNLKQVDTHLLSQQRIEELEEELFYTRQSLHAAVEELEGTNEELQSANEEMQSGNEELQSTNEELQSANEELQTLNKEYQDKVGQLSRRNDDINNLMTSANIAAVFVDRQHRVRLTSPGISEIVRIGEQDIGRPIENFNHGLNDLDLSHMIRLTLENETGYEREASAEQNRHFLVRCDPFVTSDNEIDGVVIAFTDITALKKTEFEAHRLAAIVTNSDDAIILRNRNNEIVSWNHGAERIYGWRAEEAINRSFNVIVPDDLEGEEARHFNGFIQNRKPSTFTTRRLTKMGQLIWVRVSYTAINDDLNNLCEVAVIEHDISDYRRMEQETKLAALAFDAIDGIMITDAERNILRVNAAFSKITGYSQEEVLGRPSALLNAENQPANMFEKMWHELETHGKWAGETWSKHKNGSTHPEWVSVNAVRDAKGVLTHYVTVFRDISDKKADEEKIHQLAFYDALTNLPNRRLFLDRLERAILQSDKSKTYGALCFLDLDRFKNINDSLGHGIGDALLSKVAQRINAAVGKENSVARFGGDEFVLLLLNVGVNSREAIAHTDQQSMKVMQCLEEPFEIADHTLHTSASMGITLFCSKDDTPEDLLRQADNAMYLAKKQGRETVRFFDPSLQQESDALLALEKDLRVALDKNEFELHYQPQVSSAGECVAVEALIRWKKSDGTMVSPGQFIPVCEDTGLIHKVGDWVLATACEQFKLMQSELQLPLKRVAVNVSPKQFMDQGFAHKVMAAIENSGIQPENLELEITENLFLDDADSVADKMSLLKDEGIRFSIDDFGTGYSSLAYIKRLPVDQIKIDQTFIRDILLDQDDASIVESIIAMAEKMGLDLIAEGVEQQGQVDFLIKNGCHFFQGFFYSRPTPIEKLSAVCCLNHSE